MHTTAEPAAAGQAAHAAHALDAAASPLVRALPQYERGFRDHLAEAAALAAAGQQRLAAAVRLANEMEVQVRPGDLLLHLACLSHCGGSRASCHACFLWCQWWPATWHCFMLLLQLRW